MEIRADLVVGATAGTRWCATAPGLKVDDMGAPIDVLWFRAAQARRPDRNLFGRIRRRQDAGDARPRRLLAMRLRHRRREQFDAIKARGLDAFRARDRRMAPSWRSRGCCSLGRCQAADGHDRPAERWYRPGLLCIGDAAHAMSPVGGVGINLAIQDAVAAANILAAKLADGCPAGARTRCGAPAPGIPGADDAADAGGRPEQHHQPCAQAGRAAAESTFARPRGQCRSMAAGDYGAIGRRRCAPGACALTVVCRRFRLEPFSIESEPGSGFLF